MLGALESAFRKPAFLPKGGDALMNFASGEKELDGVINGKVNSSARALP